MQKSFETASEWIRYESRRRAAPIRWVAYGLLVIVFATGFLLGTSASWFPPFGLPFTATFLVADLLFLPFALRATRLWRKFQRMLAVISERSIAEERATLGDDSWRVSMSLMSRIILEEIDKFQYPDKPTFEPLEDATTDGE